MASVSDSQLCALCCTAALAHSGERQWAVAPVQPATSNALTRVLSLLLQAALSALPLPWRGVVVVLVMSSPLAELVDLTGADEATAGLFLESCDFDLNAAASAYFQQQQATEQRTGRQLATMRQSASADDDIPAPLPTREEQLFDGQIRHTIPHCTALHSTSHTTSHTAERLSPPLTVSCCVHPLLLSAVCCAVLCCGCLSSAASAGLVSLVRAGRGGH